MPNIFSIFLSKKQITHFYFFQLQTDSGLSQKSNTV